MKKKRIYLLLAIIIIVLIIVGVIVFKPSKKEKQEPVTIVDTLESYGYELMDNTSEYQRFLFESLKKVLGEETINEESYAKALAQLFLADFYTLSNKVSKNDVGGIQYVYGDFKEDFTLFAKSSVYDSVLSNIYGDRDQELPSVSKVNIDKIETKNFKYLDTNDDNAFYIEASIEYVKDLGYDKKRTLVIVHSNEKLEIAKMK